MKRSLKVFEKKTLKSVQKLRVNKNKQTEYTKKLVKRIPVGSVQRQRTNATACSGQWERTRLGRIYNVEIRYQVSGMSKFRCGDPFGFVSSIFIS